jgi:hypothetical protein
MGFVTFVYVTSILMFESLPHFWPVLIHSRRGKYNLYHSALDFRFRLSVTTLNMYLVFDYI